MSTRCEVLVACVERIRLEARRGDNENFFLHLELFIEALSAIRDPLSRCVDFFGARHLSFICRNIGMTIILGCLEKVWLVMVC